MSKSINLAPSWEAAARIMIMGLENGTEAGKAAARELIVDMGQRLDQILLEFEANDIDPAEYRGNDYGEDTIDG